MGAKEIRYAYNMNGSSYEVINAFPIATGTVIEKGEIVLLTAGFITAIGDADQNDPYLGMATEGHDGATAGRNVGLEILVSCSPTAVFKCKPNITTTADSGNTTTWVDAELTAVPNDTWNGGWLKLKTTTAITLPIDKLMPITDFTTSSGTFAGAYTGGVTAGDTAIMLPPYNSHAFDLDSDGTNIDFKTAGGESINIVDVDTELEEVYFMLRLHQFGNGVVAI